MKHRTSRAGDHGYLYVDLIAALVILSLSMTSLFSVARNLKESRIKVEKTYEYSLEKYETKLLDQTTLQ